MMHPRQIPAGCDRAALALVLITLLLLGCGRQSESAVRTGSEAGRSEATPVIVTEVEMLAEETRLEAVGTSRALRSVILFPASAGQVTALHFGPGQRVSAGDTLLQLEQRQQALAVELAGLRLADAERLLARYQRMRGGGAITQAEIDDAASAVEAARIELQQARIVLEDRRVVAPFDGYVGITEIDAGDRIDTDTAITTLDDRSALLVSFDVPEILIGRLRSGTSIALATWAAADATRAEGRIVDIDSRIDPITRTFVARARVDNSADKLRPGMSFRINLALRGAEYPVVPEIAVQWGGDGAYVWRVDDGRASRLAVGIVQRRQGRILVDAALTDGARVVVEGVQRMREGLAVSFLETPSGAGDSLQPASGAGAQ